jgi:S-adenosylmethionine:tRNA ribosyltransferase-isomerase
MQDDFSLESYDYILPEKNIAQHPSKLRDQSKLLILDRKSGHIAHKRFSEIAGFFNKGDILVVNDTKVFPARLFGTKETGGKAEVFLLELPREKTPAPHCRTRNAEVTALIKSSKRPARGSKIHVGDTLTCTVIDHLENGRVHIELHYPAQFNLIEILLEHGSVPLPPYIERPTGITDDDRHRYQTVYADAIGAVAAPTAGLHFTQPILDILKDKGVEISSLTLHVGYGTFAPVRTESIRDHRIHREFISISAETATRIQAAKERGGKVWAVGTTTVRALEFSGNDTGAVREISDWCDLYITPGYTFKVIDNLITNFHLPKSSLLFLVSALCGRETLLQCYRKAIAGDYRFYSYGDAMAILS